ncbi:MAG TPA: hypothetical protein PLL30_17100 [Candidatus Krumholzibacteria bacterium]|nr:hypothetical protein [Candidatus Krumholzibacteria bacterium]
MALRYNKWWATDYAFDPIEVEFGPLIFPGEDGYVPPTGTVDHEFDTPIQYSGPQGSFVHDFADPPGTQRIVTRSAGEPLSMPAVSTVSWRQYAADVTLGEQGEFGVPSQIIRRWTVAYEFTTAYTVPSPISHNFGGAAGELLVDGWDSLTFGAAEVSLKNRTIYPASFNNFYSGQHALIYRQIAYTFAIDAESWGTPSVVNRNRYLLASGFDASAIGNPTVENLLKFVYPTGASDGSIGTPSLLNRNRYVIPVGLDAFKGFGFAGDGEGWVSFLDRSLSPDGIFAINFGAPLVANSIRVIDQAGQSITASYGAPLVAYKERFIYPSYIVQWAFGYPNIDKTHYVETTGFDASSFGLHWAHDNRQYPEPQGFDAALYGQAEVTRSPRIVAPAGFPSTIETWPSTRWGIQTVWNLRQVVTMIDERTPFDGGVFGNPIWMTVENRNRVIQTYGHKDSVFSPFNALDNKAVPLLASGIDGPLWGSNMVSHRIRSVYPEALDALLMGRWNEVANDARVLAPTGFRGDAVGQPAVVNTRRYYQLYGWDSQEFGTAFVAPRVRTITLGLGPEGFFGYHDVQLKTRYLSPPGMDPLPQFGAASFEERFTIFRPSSILPKAVGEPFVRNATPEVAPYGYEQTLWGDTLVRHQYRFVLAEGYLQTIWGSTEIADRTKTLRTASINAMRMGTGHEVRNNDPDPPSPREILPATFIATLTGTPVVRSNDIVPGGFDAIRWGNAVVTMMGCYPSSILPPDIPAPWVRGPQYVVPDTIYAPDDSRSSQPKTKHEVSPFTIWATFEATEQALANHEGAWKLMDHAVHNDEHPERPVFGTAEVTLYYRGVAPYTFGQGAVGEPQIELRNRRIYPTGLRAVRWGYPIIPHTQTVEPGGFVNEGFGQPALELKNRAILPPSLETPEISEDHYVDFFHRTLRPNGIDAFTSTEDHRLHPPEPLVPVGLDATLWGTTWVSNWLRTIEAEGFDGLDMTSTPGQFSERMRVTRRGFAIVPRGTRMTGYGTPTVAIAATAPPAQLVDLVTEL